MLMKRLLALFFIVLLVGVVPINADENEKYNQVTYVNKNELDEISDFFKEYGVENETILILLNKVKNGHRLDSTKEEFLDLEPQLYFQNDDSVIYKTTYPDGSIKIDSLSKGDLVTYAPYDFGGGSPSGGTTWWAVQGARAHTTNGIVSASFNVDYCGGQNTNTQIDRIYDSRVLVIGGTFSDMKLSITKKTNSGGTPASASMTFNCTTLMSARISYLKVYINGLNNGYTLATL